MEVEKRLRSPIKDASLLLLQTILRANQFKKIRHPLQRCLCRMLHQENPFLLAAIPAKAAKTTPAHAGSHHHISKVAAARSAPHIVKTHTRAHLAFRIR